jgi:hypothetical protein
MSNQLVVIDPRVFGYQSLIGNLGVEPLSASGH